MGGILIMTGGTRTLKGIIDNRTNDEKKLDYLMKEEKLLFYLFLIFVFGFSFIMGFQELVMGNYRQYYKFVIPPLITLMIGFFLGWRTNQKY